MLDIFEVDSDTLATLPARQQALLLGANGRDEVDASTLHHPATMRAMERAGLVTVATRREGSLYSGTQGNRPYLVATLTALGQRIVIAHRFERGAPSVEELNEQSRALGDNTDSMLQKLKAEGGDVEVMALTMLAADARRRWHAWALGTKEHAYYLGKLNVFEEMIHSVKWARSHPQYGWATTTNSLLGHFTHGGEYLTKKLAI